MSIGIGIGLHLGHPQPLITMAQLPGLKMEFDVSCLTGLADGDACATLTDKSGNARHATATDAARPTYKTNIVAGKPVLRFDGTVNVMTTVTTPAIAQPTTVYVVAKMDDATVGQTFFDSTTDAYHILDIKQATWRELRVFGGTALTSAALRATNAWHVYAVQFNGASSLLDVDGRTLLSGDVNTRGLAGISIGARGGATKLYFDGDLAYLAVFGAAHSAGQRSQALAYLRSKFGSRLGRIVTDGDSLTYGSGSTDGLTYPYQLGVLTGRTITNNGYGGDTSATLMNRAQDLAFGGLTLDDVYVLWIGTNDLLASIAPATTYANITEVVARRYYGGYSKILVCTLPDCRMVTRPADYDTKRATLNGLIVAGAAANGYGLVRLDSDSRIGDNGDAEDTTYFIGGGDKCHMNNTGYGVVASLVAAAL